jgi:hypothetical protein
LGRSDSSQAACLQHEPDPDPQYIWNGGL